MSLYTTNRIFDEEILSSLYICRCGGSVIEDPHNGHSTCTQCGEVVDSMYVNTCRDWFSSVDDVNDDACRVHTIEDDIGVLLDIDMTDHLDLVNSPEQVISPQSPNPKIPKKPNPDIIKKKRCVESKAKLHTWADNLHLTKKATDLAVDYYHRFELKKNGKNRKI